MNIQHAFVTSCNLFMLLPVHHLAVTVAVRDRTASGTALQRVTGFLAKRTNSCHG
jgi:hypothetical protein